ncbi:hypothetical protein AWZ03_006948 [Drosophila navojoa]|uniref:Uncharacterized protein n=1 Tax=Drosophila navojoa TaxID=7232 RepID=A0A484BCR4_DRONA|nr:hypothetical protein AWZ03_006948 [Drosophila navojoa]
MLNAVRTNHSVYVVGNSSSRKALAVTVAEEEEAAALSSIVHLDYGEFKFSTTSEKHSKRGFNGPHNGGLWW